MWRCRSLKLLQGLRVRKEILVQGVVGLERKTAGETGTHDRHTDPLGGYKSTILQEERRVVEREAEEGSQPSPSTSRSCADDQPPKGGSLSASGGIFV